MIKVRNGVAYITVSREPLLTGRRPDAKKDPAGTDYKVKVQPPFKPKHDFGNTVGGLVLSPVVMLTEQTW